MSAELHIEQARPGPARAPLEKSRLASAIRDLQKQIAHHRPSPPNAVFRVYEHADNLWVALADHGVLKLGCEGFSLVSAVPQEAVELVGCARTTQLAERFWTRRAELSGLPLNMRQKLKPFARVFDV